MRHIKVLSVLSALSVGVIATMMVFSTAYDAQAQNKKSQKQQKLTREQQERLKHYKIFMDSCNPRQIHLQGDACNCYVQGMETVMPIKAFNDFSDKANNKPESFKEGEVEQFYGKLEALQEPFMKCLKQVM